MDAINALIKYIREKRDITDLEKDILDMVHEVEKNPFDINSAKIQLATNRLNHFKDTPIATPDPGIPQKSLLDLSDDDVKYNLQKQLIILAGKERREQQWQIN